ncbi:MAG: TIM barrel protein [Terracidiphilus sp.]
MNRRKFTQALATAALSAAVPEMPVAAKASSLSREARQAPQSSGAQFSLSVMLWTVFHDLPFEQRLEKVAEAGYTNIELVGEYSKWSTADFANANAARKRLGITFDATAGLHHSMIDPASRDALIAELGAALQPMETLACSAMIMLTGNTIPGLSRETQHQNVVETLKRAAASVEGKQIDGQPVRILLECIDPEENPKYFLTSAAEGMEVVRQVNHPQVQFLYDMFHEQIGHGNLIEKLEKNIDIVALIHVADVPGRHQPGTGEIDYGNIFKKLGQLNYRKMVAMEFMPNGDEVAALKEAKKLALTSAMA